MQPFLSGPTLAQILLFGLGLACVAWTARELAACLLRARRGSFEFGAVETDTGRPLHVVVDRRGRERREAARFP